MVKPNTGSNLQLFYLLCKRVKRGAGGVPIVDIVVVVVARSIQVVRIVSVVIVAGTQPPTPDAGYRPKSKRLLHRPFHIIILY